MIHYFSRTLILAHLMTIAFVIILVSCKQKNEERKIGISTLTNNDRFENYRKSMSQIGETSICDTNIYNRILYFDNWYLNSSRLVCLRDFANDTLSIISICKIIENGSNYFSDSGYLKEGIFAYPHKLNKVVTEIPRSKSKIIFDYLDKLVINKTILPFGTFVEKKNIGDIVDGGEWLIYINGNAIYECQLNKIDSLSNIIYSNIDLKKIDTEFSIQIP